MARSIRRATRNPLAVATMIDLLHGYASGKPAATPLEEAVAQGLARRDYDRTRAGRMVETFFSIPTAIKAPVFGKFVPGHMRALPEDTLRAIFTQPDTVFLLEDDVGTVDVPEFPPGTRFSIDYTGLYCQERTGDRPLTGPSDEPYVITVAFNIEDSQDPPQGLIHPVGDPDQNYGGVDSHTWRTGPIATIWSGPEPEAEISIVTVVMEHDEGDHDAYKEQVEAVVELAALIAAYFNVPLGAAIKAFGDDLILWVLDSDDDEIGTAYTAVTPEWLKRWAAVSPIQFFQKYLAVKAVAPWQWTLAEAVDNTDIDHHFLSRHTDDGHYVVLYRVRADQDPVTPPQFPVDVRLNQEIFVVDF